MVTHLLSSILLSCTTGKASSGKLMNVTEAKKQSHQLHLKRAQEQY